MQETWVWSLGWEDPWRREWLHTPVCLPGEFHGQRSLMGYSPWGRRESDVTEHAHKNCYYLKKWTIIFKNVCFFICHFLLSRYCYFCPYLFTGTLQLLSRIWFFVTPWTTAHQASLSITNSQSLLKLMSIELVMPSNHLIFCHPLLFLPLIFPCIRVFSKESVLPLRWPKYWSFSFGIRPSNEYSGLISFRMDWLDLFTVQGTLKSLLQYHSSKASILQCSAFFMVQLWHPCMTCIQISQEAGQVVWYPG